MRFSELHCREVINLCDGARMGEVCDLIFDPACGQISAIVVPSASGLFGMFSREGCIIPWSCIETLGRGLYPRAVPAEIRKKQERGRKSRKQAEKCKKMIDIGQKFGYTIRA